MFLDSGSPSEALGRQGPVPELPASGRSWQAVHCVSPKPRFQVPGGQGGGVGGAEVVGSEDQHPET